MKIGGQHGIACRLGRRTEARVEQSVDFLVLMCKVYIPCTLGTREKRDGL